MMLVRVCKLCIAVLLTLHMLVTVSNSSTNNKGIRERLMSTGLLGESSTLEELLLASTLDGSLYALEADTGRTKWMLHDDPVVMNPKDVSQPTLARFFPNPRDGSLYRYILGSPEHPLKKLPFTIAQLVENSPCRSNDGIFYLGKKVDSFIVLNRVTGKKQLVLNMQSIYESCSADSKSPSPPTLFLGRTMYNVMLYEHSTGNRWNVTYYDYTTQSAIDDAEYGFVHYVAAGAGNLVTMNKANEDLMWSIELDSPIVALFSLTDEGNLLSLPLTVIASQTLQRYLREMPRRGSYLLTAHPSSIHNLSPSIYIGESRSGSTYVMPSLVDDQVLTIKRMQPSTLLLEGPDDDEESDAGNKKHYWRHKHRIPYMPGQLYQKDPADSTAAVAASVDVSDALGVAANRLSRPVRRSVRARSPKPDTLLSNCDSEDGRESVVVLGHYIVPDELNDDVYPMKPGSLPLGITYLKESKTHPPTGAAADDSKNSSADAAADVPALPDKHRLVFDEGRTNVIYMPRNAWYADNLMLVIMLLIVAALCYCIYLLRGNSNHQGSSSGTVLPSGSGRSGRGSNTSTGTGGEGGEVTALVEELTDGTIRVGKITYQPDQQLGKGSEGTIVYRGAFEGRVAAVKRVLPNSYLIADREVELLRSSDHHRNVIRYLCTEQCREFRYIALELCDATLEQYVNGLLDGFPPDPDTNRIVIQQATRGLEHLHCLNIVHRDIKPSNVLLQLPRSFTADISGAEHGLRVLISDFGLCKKLEAGHASFTKHSGITGTDGWIAPEMIKTEPMHQKPTQAVDVFSLGCVYYYVVTYGQHPFGSPINRQSNIIAGTPDLSGTGNVCLTDLLEAMLCPNPALRPPVRALRKHPYFWDANNTLNFLVDVSDRVDKNPNDYVSLLLELGSSKVMDNWLAEMDPVVLEDLKQHRDYRDGRVRDLLRAIRNKRTHYQELRVDVRRVLGSVPTQFLHYWTSRFPGLLHHTWRVLHCCKTEHVFAKYYHKTYSFHTIDQESLLMMRASSGMFAEPGGGGGIRCSPNSGDYRSLTSKSFSKYNKKQSYTKAAGDASTVFANGNMQHMFNARLNNLDNWRERSQLPADAAGVRSATVPAADGKVQWIIPSRQTVAGGRYVAASTVPIAPAMSVAIHSASDTAITGDVGTANAETAALPPSNVTDNDMTVAGSVVDDVSVAAAVTDSSSVNRTNHVATHAAVASESNEDATNVITRECSKVGTRKTRCKFVYQLPGTTTTAAATTDQDNTCNVLSSTDPDCINNRDGETNLTETMCLNKNSVSWETDEESILGKIENEVSNNVENYCGPTIHPGTVPVASLETVLEENETNVTDNSASNTIGYERTTNIIKNDNSGVGDNASSGDVEEIKSQAEEPTQESVLNLEQCFEEHISKVMGDVSVQPQGDTTKAVRRRRKKK